MMLRIIHGKLKPGTWDSYERAYKDVVAKAGKIPGLKGRWLAHADDDPDADALARQRRALYGAAKREGKPMAQITPVEIDGKHYYRREPGRRAKKIRSLRRRKRSRNDGEEVRRGLQRLPGWAGGSAGRSAGGEETSVEELWPNGRGD